MAEMLGNIREIIRDLAAFFVLSTVLLRLLPGENYGRYLRFFLGLLLVVSLLKPILSAFSAEDLLADVLNLDLDAIGGEMEDSIAVAAAGEWKEILEAYREEIREQINAQISDLGVRVADISVDEKGEILTFVIAEAGDSPESDGNAETVGLEWGAGSAEARKQEWSGGSVEAVEQEQSAGSAEAGKVEERDKSAEEKDLTDSEKSTGSGSSVCSDTGADAAEKGAAGAIKIEIPVISVFADAGEEEIPGDEGEGGSPEKEREDGITASAGGAIAPETIVIVQERIAEYCGIGEEFVKVLAAEN